MIITFYHQFDGVGKTSLAYNMSKDFDFDLISNTNSVIETIYPERAKIVKKLQVIHNRDIIYDMSDLAYKNIDIFKASNLVVIPSNYDINSINETINTVNEVNRYCQNILIIVNRIMPQTEKKYKNNINILKALNKELMFMNESEAIRVSMHTGKTLTELYEDDSLQFRPNSIYANYQKILEKAKELLQKSDKSIIKEGIKMGRPPKEEAEKKNKKITGYLTQKEYKKLELIALEQDITISYLVRKLTLEYLKKG